MKRIQYRRTVKKFLKNKRFFFYLTVMLFASVYCNAQSTKVDYVKLEGKIINRHSDSITIFSRTRTYSKTIKLKKDGRFKDTLRILPTETTYLFYDGREGGMLYLKNGYDIQMSFDGQDINNTLHFKGKGAAENNYLIKYESANANEVSAMGLSKELFRLKLDSTINSHLSYLKQYPNLASSFITERKALLENERTARLAFLNNEYIDSYKSYFEKEEASTAKHLMRGKESPEFANYKNFNGTTTSLKDFRGKYVYIDVWATWCSPCKKEFPFLHAIEKEYEGKGIAFVSVSVDREQDYAYWKQMVKEKGLGGTQLFADKDFKSDFIRKYGIMGIPRFIVIDPQGKIVDAHAPRPSYRVLLKQLFDSLLQIQKDYVTFSGTITNRHSDSLVLIPSVKSVKSKIIKINSDGTFKDTLSIRDSIKTVPNFTLFDGKELAFLYLKNGFDIKLTLDANEFDESLTFSGVGSAENNYLIRRVLIEEKQKNLFDYQDEAEFNKELEARVSEKMESLSKTPGLDPFFVEIQKKILVNQKKGYISSYKEFIKLSYEDYKLKFATTFDHLVKGKPSPRFSNYENFNGGTTSLKDFTGKYVYIDIWATWCGPCKIEIPHLKKIEAEYKGKNIAFVSISVDRTEDKEKWRKMVKDESLGGIQLFDSKNFYSDFIKGYEIKGIPRFILIDPDGNIVDADAPRPSFRFTVKQLLDSVVK